MKLNIIMNELNELEFAENRLDKGIARVSVQ